MNILKVTLNELDQVSQLFNQYRMFYGQASNLEGAKEFIKERIENNESVIFLAMENDSPAGFVQLYPIFTSVGMNRKWLLNDLFVAEDYRRHGVGKALMNKAKDLAVETRAAGILLETTKDNVKAQALYESLGYEKEDAVYFYNLSI
ncbi:GNAT family N-acetyltransferase [Metabacillus litoralis]|uniref:GNAT family N-acetyltransferase n=1 Tax=Metabacillus TaxID=2675233 RepID=UPI001B9272FB|nr:GNAT family N-acetyltransferase [Metabacillus litoralis]MCM3162199.1 GNAT family N-acetyltransferase [Metabacillus litoralis]UHA61714.1 GNAT family N-acetyltransferase [Metabacillus litoralis]